MLPFNMVKRSHKIFSLYLVSVKIPECNRKNPEQPTI